MAARVSESLILRTYPYREADLIVSFLARDLGKLRGVAQRARRPKSKFGAGMERLSHIWLFYFQKETHELVTLDSCELIQSTFGLETDYAVTVALDYLAEVSDQILAPGEPNERFFRLLLAVLDHLRRLGSKGVWSAVTYFTLWSVRLAGFLPELKVSASSLALAEEMQLSPVSQLSNHQWTKHTAADLRRFLVRQLEEHLERRLITAQMLENL